jgi:putative DNA primase/helicase
MSNTIDRILSSLSDAHESNGGWSARCPAHEDRRASLSINQGDDGRVLLHCHAGCEPEAVVGKLGLTMKDLMMPSTNGNGTPKKCTPRIVATYDYRDADGTLLRQSCRYVPKNFKQRVPKPGGGWTWSVKDIKKVPYRLPELLAADPAKIVFIVEGEKDVDRLCCLGLVAITNSGGAGKWSKDFAQYLAGRSVVILPDNDAPGCNHAHDVTAKLNGTAASIKIVELPGLPEKGDVSDWLDAGHSVDELQTLVDAAPAVTAEDIAAWEAEKSTNKISEDDEPGRVKTLADAICLKESFAQDAGGKLYRYDGGAYRPHADKYIKSMVKTMLTAWGDTKAWSTRLASEVVEFIRVDAQELPDRPRLDLINVKNGMVRVVDGLLLPHDPKYLSVVQLPVNHDPAAMCLNIDAFVESTFPADAHDLAWEIPGVLMTPATWLQKAILLLGEGCNGKSCWLSLLVRFLGRHNVAAIPLHKLEIDKFSVSRLVGKLANICADLPSEHLAGTSTFKALTGGDTLNAEYKFKDSFDLEPFARLVFSANHPPRSADSSPAFFRRWIVIPFDHTFGPDEQIPRDVLDARLQSPGELSGMLNKALEGLRRVEKQRRFSESPSIQEAWRDFHSTTDPLAVWLDRYTIDDPESFITKKALRVAYNAAVEREGRPSMTDTAFSLAIQKLRPNIEKKQRTVAGKLQWCFVGIGMLHPADDSQPSQGSQGSHTCYQRTRARDDKSIEGSSSIYPKGENPVNPVNPVNCPHHNIQETTTYDGYVNRQCRDCGAYLPCIYTSKATAANGTRCHAYRM